MKRPRPFRPAHLLLAGILAAAVSAARAAEPAVTCQADGATVTQLLCRDPALAAADRRLQSVYRAALAQAGDGAQARRLRADQRGWIKGRNDCWKAGSQTWLTATWTVSTVRDCVEAQTRMRTAELQAVWRLLPPVTTAHACQGNPAHELLTHAFDTDPPTLRIERGDQTLTLWQVPAADGSQTYEGRNISAQRIARGWQVRWLDVRTGVTEVLDCKVRG